MKHRFQNGDILRNTIRTHPQHRFLLYEGSIYRNNDVRESGSFLDPVLGTPDGYVSLYELNVDRGSDFLIYPFMVKDGKTGYFKTVPTASYGGDYQYGDTIRGSYPMTASIGVNVLATGEARPQVNALQNLLNGNRVKSSAYLFSGSRWNKAQQAMSHISVPKIYYMDRIRPGSIRFSFYVSGSLVSELHDKYHNGELIEVTGSNEGAVAGVALYHEGEILVTGSWDLDAAHTENYLGTGDIAPKWHYFGANLTDSTEYSAWRLQFDGDNAVPTVTMFCHAKAGQMVHSNNPTYIEYGQALSPMSGGTAYVENDKLRVKNTVKSWYNDPDADMKKQTWISKIVIYDNDGEAIGIAKLAQPVRKTDMRNLTFKLALDL